MVGYKEVVPRRPMTRRVTLEEVARAAGVSRATVSRVVNGVTSVDENIRQAVEEAISTTGYLPNLAARRFPAQAQHDPAKSPQKILERKLGRALHA